MQRGTTTINNLVLLIVIVIGVAGGNLLADWLSAQIAAYRGESTGKGASKTGRAGGGQAQEPAATKIPMPGDIIRTQQEQTREQRRRDRDGVRLGQTCEEWRQASVQLKSETARDEMKRHCGIYERYVQDGVLPAKK